MKKILLLASCVLLLTDLSAQTNVYKPFPTKKAVWVNQRGTFISSTTTNWRNPDYFSIDGKDTVINGLTYSKVMYDRDLYHGALRDNNGKVYYIPANTTTDLLVYDFTVHKGDAVEVYSFGSINETNKLGMHISQTCQGIDSVLIDGSYRKRINFGSASWIEGIGHTQGLFVPTAVCTCDHDMLRMICMSEEDNRLFPSFAASACEIPIIIPPSAINERSGNSAVELFPNPTTGKFRISAQNELNTVDVINLLGQVIYAVQSKNKFIDIDISTVQAGIYYVRLRDLKENASITKIIKE